jgi:H+-transporting ATPase
MNHFKGLSTEEALEKIKKVGYNTLPEEKNHLLKRFLEKFWAPIPWMLEIVIVLEYVLGKTNEALIILALLLFNVFLSFFQERKATKALVLLKSQLNIQARVLRNDEWLLISAKEIVPDDVICIRMGDIVPADAEILSGSLLVDQSSLTGESLPKEISISQIAYAGSLAKKGEAFARVKKTGKNTNFGKTAELISEAKNGSHLQKIIFQIIKHLIVFNSVIVLGVFIYSVAQHLPLIDIIPFLLLILVATIPVALPATYTLACALGSVKLSKKGLLITKLSAIEEAAGMTILCMDKTGTITKNTLEVSQTKVYKKYTESDLLILASLACEVATQDPIDLAILKHAQNLQSPYQTAEKILYIPFDPANKCSESVILYNNKRLRILKGDPKRLLNMTYQNQDIAKDVEHLASDGSRVVAVIVGEEHNGLEMVGLIALYDPPREDSYSAIKEIEDLHVKVMMITGDSLATAKSIAAKVGLGKNIITREELYQKPFQEIAACDGVAQVFPEDKFYLINLFQKQGYTCGMTGDGVNDAPALKKADVGIALINATDVAKNSANIVLTKPGFKDLIAAIHTSRKIYERMLTYTLNKIIKTLEIALLLTLGLVLTNQLIISPLLIVLLLFANDFVAMSISTDHVYYSEQPAEWNMKKILGLSFIFAFLILLFSFGVLYIGKNVFLLDFQQTQTWVFLLLVFTGQGTIYLIRERQSFGKKKPSVWMVLSTIFDLTVVSFLAYFGIFMAPIKGIYIGGLFLSVFFYFFLLNLLKMWICKKIALV